jgi:hypothetical protein
MFVGAMFHLGAYGVSEMVHDIEASESMKEKKEGLKKVRDLLMINSAVKKESESLGNGKDSDKLDVLRDLLNKLDVGTQYRGFYAGVGFSRGKKGVHCAAGKPVVAASYIVPVGGMLVGGTDPARRAVAAGNQFFINRIIYVVAQYRAQNIALTRADGSALLHGDLVSAAAIQPGHFDMLTVAVATGGVKMTSLVVSEARGEIDESKKKGGMAALAGYGNIFFNRAYVGMEFMQSLSSAVKCKYNLGGDVKSSGSIPSAALRLGLVKYSWLFYGKIGGSQLKVTGLSKSDKKISALYGFGVEKAFGKGFSVRMDGDYTVKSTHDVACPASQQADLRWGIVGGPAGAGAIGPAAVGGAAHGGLVPGFGGSQPNEDTKVKRKGSYNLRLFIVYHI